MASACLEVSQYCLYLCRANSTRLRKRDHWKLKRNIGKAVKHSLAQEPAEDSDNEVIGRGFCVSARPKARPAKVEDNLQTGLANQLLQARHKGPLSILANGSCESEADARVASMNSAPRKRQKLSHGRGSSSQRRSYSSRAAATLPVRRHCLAALCTES